LGTSLFTNVISTSVSAGVAVAGVTKLGIGCGC